jgi:lysophospholipase L1-like esterase
MVRGGEGGSTSLRRPLRRCGSDPGLQRCILAAIGAFAMGMTPAGLAAQGPPPPPDACTIDAQPNPASRLNLPGRFKLLRPQADWAWLCLYRADNERLRAAGLRPQGVFIGDSITQFWPVDDPGFFTSGRVGRGISGQTSAQILLRFQQDAIALKPRYIHLLVGTNDIAGNPGGLDQASFRGNMQMMVALARQHRIPLFIGSIPPADRIPWREQAGVAARIRAENLWLMDLASKPGVTFIDYTPALATDSGALRPEFTTDGVHPNPAGYAAMQSVATRYLPGLR